MSYLATNIGMPRIGRKRELKFAIEKYWRNEINNTDLKATAEEIVKLNYKLQIESSISLIPVNDFTYYDRMLDLCALTGLTPSRFDGLESKSYLDNYFRYARGEGKIPAMEMTKWFDTNYHYIVPEIELGSKPNFNKDFFDHQILPNGDKSLQNFTLIGPITFLSLAKANENVADKYAFYGALKEAFDQILCHVNDLGFTKIHLEEPILGSDLNPKQKELFADFYNDLKTRTSPDSRFQLSTYFGNVENNINLILESDIDVVHLDLMTDESNEENLKKIREKFSMISLGVISGRNIWKMNLHQTAKSIINATEGLGFKEIHIGPTTSLQHVPYSLRDEDNIPEEVIDWLAFAEEKLKELDLLVSYLNKTTDDKDERVLSTIESNRSRLSSELVNNKAVLDRMRGLSNTDFFRDDSFKVRQKIQKDHFGFPLLPTTTIGSFPQTESIRNARAEFNAGSISESEYKKFIENEISECIDKQEALGVDVLVHGEAERNDMVQYFGELLSGFTFTRFGWVQSYGTRCVKPPIIYGDVERKEPMTVEWAKFAQSKTKKKMKGMLTGPVTILQWSFVRDDQSRDLTCKQIALAMRDEVQDLEASGIDVIQVDEAAIREGLPIRKSKHQDYLKWSVDAFKLTTAGVCNQTQIHTHMCYSEFNDVMDSIAAMDADVISIECSRSNMELLNIFKEKKYPNEIGPGVWDIHSPRVPSLDELEALIEKAAEVIDVENLWINPDCGLKTRGWPEVESTLKNMIQATENVRSKLTT